MYKETAFTAVAIFGALIAWSAVDDWVKRSVGKVTARGDVWTSGYEAGYDRGYSDGHRGGSRLHAVHGDPHQQQH